MKIFYANKLIVGFAVINFVLVGIVYYIFVFQKSSVEAMNEHCNVKLLEDNLVGNPLPKYEFTDIEKKDVYEILTQGKVLMIVFSSNCDACLVEFESVESHYDEISPQIKVFAVSGESIGVIEQFVTKRKPVFPIYLDVRGSLILKEGIVCTPTLLFLDNGFVKKIRVGNTQNYKDLLEDF